MSESTIKQLPVQQRIALHTELIRGGILPSCTTCGSGTLSKGGGPLLCEKWKANPPPEVVNVGCEHWEYMPF